jgi:Flp pilus assembly protein TadD
MPEQAGADRDGIGTAARPPGGTLPLWPAALLIALGAAIYANSLRGVFLLDDVMWIVENPRLRQAWPEALGLDGARPVLAASLALNYLWSGLETWSYHLVNAAAHIAAGLALFGVARRTLRLPGTGRSSPAQADGIALAAAALWLAHPLQTAAVDYVVQRGEVFMGLFCLLTLYALIRAAGAARPAGWLAVAVASCAAGMGSKESMVVAPALAATYDVIFLTGSARETLRRRWSFYLALAATCALLVPWFVRLQGASNASAGFAVREATPLTYALTQPGVVLHYLTLTVWPHPLSIDYGRPFAQRAAEVWPALAAVALLLGATAWALWRSPRWGYLGLWFFVALAPASSFVPVADACFEHRMYLPLAALTTLAAAGAGLAWSRRGELASAAPYAPAAVAAIVVAALGTATVARNAEYRDAAALWRGALEVNPRNARAQFNYGHELARGGRAPEGLAHMARAAELKPGDAAVRNGYGKALAMAGRTEEARREFEAALAANPRMARALDNLGVLEARAGRFARAAEFFARAVELRPEDAEARNNLGMALLRLGRRAEGVAQLREAARLRPDAPAFRRNLNRAEAAAPGN